MVEVMAIPVITYSRVSCKEAAGSKSAATAQNYNVQSRAGRPVLWPKSQGRLVITARAGEGDVFLARSLMDIAVLLRNSCG